MVYMIKLIDLIVITVAISVSFKFFRRGKEFPWVHQKAFETQLKFGIYCGYNIPSLYSTIQFNQSIQENIQWIHF